jgi:hypothetical protein
MMRETPPADFEYTFIEYPFTVHTSDSREVPLVPNAEQTLVTSQNLQLYFDLAMQCRLHEFDKQVAAVRRGLGQIVPLSLLNLYTGSQLEVLVCGSPEIDIKLLESVTEYSGCSSSDAHVRLFWKAVEEFNNEERAALLRFTWGRSRLPLTAAGFIQRFKIQGFGRTPADSYFPVSHTCFFSLELPTYTTLEIMKDKLRYAIFNCSAIDADDTSTGLAAAALGWEE